MNDQMKESMSLLEQDALVSLFELDATKYGQGILRFTNDFVDGALPTFNGFQYEVIPMEAEGFEWSGEGTLPRPTMTITAMELAFLSLVISADDLVGMPVKRIRTYRKHLDDGSLPDTEATLPIDYYVIERKNSMTKDHIQFELSVKMDQEGRMIPHRQVLRDTCTHTYRWWDGTQYQYEGVTCPYAGTGEWDAAGVEQPQGSGNDKCGKKISDCKLRFGENGVLPTRAFPGVGRVK